jgi:D-hexose-6-phosphate mutarotase
MFNGNLPESAKILPGNNDLPRIVINTPQASAEIYLHGAHLTSWHPAHSSEVIFLSKQSFFQSDKAIRGGIPICFPWFGPRSGPKSDPPAPQHGFARTSAWKLDAVVQSSDSVEVILTLDSDESNLQQWPHPFHAEYRVSIGQRLKLEFTVTNTGRQDLTYEAALHTYFQVTDATKIIINGLDQTTFLDNLENKAHKTQQGPITMAQPIDNIYLETASTVEIHDPANPAHKPRTIRNEKQNSNSTVVWNPGPKGAAALTDMADEEWQNMACVETCNVRESAIHLAPNQSHTMTAIVTVI